LTVFAVAGIAVFTGGVVAGGVEELQLVGLNGDVAGLGEDIGLGVGHGWTDG